MYTLLLRLRLEKVSDSMARTNIQSAIRIRKFLVKTKGLNEQGLYTFQCVFIMAGGFEVTKTLCDRIIGKILLLWLTLSSNLGFCFDPPKSKTLRAASRDGPALLYSVHSCES